MTGSGNEGKTCKLIVCVVSENVVEEERDAFECVHITIAFIYLWIQTMYLKQAEKNYLQNLHLDY